MAPRASARLPHGPWLVTMRAKAEIERSEAHRQSIIIDRDPLSGEQSQAHRENRRAGAREEIEGISDLRDESDRDGMRIVIELKRGEVARGGAQSALQANADADHLRRHHAGPGRQSAADPALIELMTTSRVPPRGRAASHPVRSAQGGRARPYSRRPEDRARSARPGDRAHPRVEEPRRSPRRADDAVRPARSRRRPSSTCSCSA